ncbi:aminoglycoside phosphotransferase family protein [Pullulanibacillus sp. KACC 23026]|uniref:aminoglycoside phosphotransferase family protein n=1 Tax=Pullulanibacillus sp. KACC 23026 TaxID=3028315 RepID=UPI0023B20637|nr:aminoglycoside phosphotransferase family protein [Pullulanibacillus sp. KACC 23026]WEG13730.1 aminoglycoside phosphotransferase family protein [Pullulanibacillus sp. KACC 23026]
MDLPDRFIRKIKGAFGKDGEEWLLSLNERVLAIQQAWRLSDLMPVPNLSYNYVLKGHDETRTPILLKLGLPSFDFSNERKALQAYAGAGCCQLLKADDDKGAMLLEQIVPGQMLSELTDEEEVLHQFSKVWKAIRRPVPNMCEFPTIRDWSKGLDRYLSEHSDEEEFIPVEEVWEAKALFDDLLAEENENGLLHGDLHHENILFSDERGPLAIDPKGVVGPVYFDCVSFMINHLHNKTEPEKRLAHRVDYLAKSLSLDKKSMLKAAIALSTLFACWSIGEADPEWNKTYRCVQWFKDQLASC